MLAVLHHKVYLPCDLIPVSVVDPKQDVGDDAEGHPRKLQVLLDFRVRAPSVLNDRESDVEEGDGAQDAD